MSAHSYGVRERCVKVVQPVFESRRLGTIDRGDGAKFGMNSSRGNFNEHRTATVTCDGLKDYPEG